MKRLLNVGERLCLILPYHLGNRPERYGATRLDVFIKHENLKP